jgi:hypothetical protein
MEDLTNKLRQSSEEIIPVFQYRGAISKKQVLDLVDGIL